jgi:hypothetical protein
MFSPTPSFTDPALAMTLSKSLKMSAVTRSAGFMFANADQPNAEIVLCGRPLTQIAVAGALFASRRIVASCPTTASRSNSFLRH